MATKELRELSQRYNGAYTAFSGSVQVCQTQAKGEWPDTAVTKADETAFAELASARQDLWRALHAHTRKP